MGLKSNRPYWWRFAYLNVGMVFYTMCRTGFPVGLAAMGQEFTWSTFEISVLSTIFLEGQAVIAIPAGYWIDRFDRKRIIFVGLLGIGLFTALVSFAVGFWSALIYRVAFGVMEGIYNIAQFAIGGSLLPQNRALANGLVEMSFAAGNYIGQTTVGSLLQVHLEDWQLPLWWLGGVTTAYAVISLALFRRQYLRRFETPNEMTIHGFWQTLGLVTRNIGVWKALTIHACNMIPNWAVLGLSNFIFIRYRHYDPSFSALVFGVGYSAGALMVPLGTIWADRFGRRPVICVLGFWTALTSFLLFEAAPPNWTMVVLGGCVAFGIHALYSLGYTITQDAVASISMNGIGIATGVAGGFGYLLTALAGPLVGALIPITGPLWAIDLVVVGGELIVTLLAFWFLKQETWPLRMGGTEIGGLLLMLPSQ